ncbi:unnamed protein product, partial [Adineta steineri]
METLRNLKIYNIRPTPTILELTDRSKVNPEGVVDDVIVSIDSWEYPVDFIILQPKSNLGGHPLILGAKVEIILKLPSPKNQKD